MTIGGHLTKEDIRSYLLEMCKDEHPNNLQAFYEYYEGRANVFMEQDDFFDAERYMTAAQVMLELLTQHDKSRKTPTAK